MGRRWMGVFRWTHGCSDGQMLGWTGAWGGRPLCPCGRCGPLRSENARRCEMAPCDMQRGETYAELFCDTERRGPLRTCAAITLLRLWSCALYLQWASAWNHFSESLQIFTMVGFTQPTLVSTSDFRRPMIPASAQQHKLYLCLRSITTQSACVRYVF